jgi:Na+-driven multidrug efflux pump
MKDKKNLVKRILISFVWFIPVCMLVGGIVGMFVGGFASSNTSGFQEGHSTGRNAMKEFMHQYGQIVFLGDVVIWFLLCFFGILPGTGKPKEKAS